jgi:hypothetical protein
MDHREQKDADRDKRQGDDDGDDDDDDDKAGGNEGLKTR